MDCRSTVLNCSIEQIYFEDKIFVIGQKTSKSVKIFTLENFRLYTVFDWQNFMTNMVLLCVTLGPLSPYADFLFFIK